MKPFSLNSRYYLLKNSPFEFIHIQKEYYVLPPTCFKYMKEYLQHTCLFHKNLTPTGQDSLAQDANHQIWKTFRVEPRTDKTLSSSDGHIQCDSESKMFIHCSMIGIWENAMRMESHRDKRSSEHSLVFYSSWKSFQCLSLPPL